MPRPRATAASLAAPGDGRDCHFIVVATRLINSMPRGFSRPRKRNSIGSMPAAAEIPIPAPVAELVGIERAVGCRAQEAFPIELGHVEGGHSAHRRDVVLEPIGADQGHLAET